MYVCFGGQRTTVPVQTLLDCKDMGMEFTDGHHLYEEKSGRLSVDLLRPSALIFRQDFAAELGRWS